MESGVYTVKELYQQMMIIAGEGIPVYHERYLKESLLKYYGDAIFISNQERRKDVVCFRSSTASILRDYQNMKTEDIEENKRAIIKTAASLIINDVKCLNFSKDKYPSLKEMTSHYNLPQSLELLLTYLIPYSPVRRNVT